MARSTTVGSVAPQFLTNARTIPHFTFEYKDPQSGVTYPITMVGADPRTSNSDTVVHTVIIPLKMSFVAAGQDTSVLTDFYYPGFTATPVTHTFDGTRRVQDAPGNVMLYGGDYTDCCTIGYHGAGVPIGHGAGSANGQGNNPVQTFIYSAWTTPGTYSGFYSDYSGTRNYPRPTRGLADIHALSHEVAERLDDPYVNNAVQPWLTPTAPQYGCTPVLETVGVWFPLAGNTTNDGFDYYGEYHPEDEVFAQWFGRGGVEAAGFHSWDGRLTFMGPRTTSIGGPYADFASYAHGC